MKQVYSPFQEPRKVAFSRDSKLVAYLMRDFTEVYDANTSALVLLHASVDYLCFTEHGTFIAGRYAGSSVVEYSMEGVPLRYITDLGAVYDVDCDARRILFTCGCEGIKIYTHVKVLDYATLKLLHMTDAGCSISPYKNTLCRMKPDLLCAKRREYLPNQSMQFAGLVDYVKGRQIAVIANVCNAYDFGTVFVVSEDGHVVAREYESRQTVEVMNEYDGFTIVASSNEKLLLQRQGEYFTAVVWCISRKADFLRMYVSSEKNNMLY